MTDLIVSILYIIGLAAAVIIPTVTANYLDKNHKEALRRERKLNREDLALHELTACDED